MEVSVAYTSTPVKSCISGDNSDLILEVSKLYLTPGQIVADVTYGRGVFWKKVDTSLYDFRPSDLLTGIDFTNLPYSNESINTVVFDPPYQPYTKSMQDGLSDRYGLNSSNLWTIEDVIELYRKGISEASRVLTNPGRLWIKCQDVTYNHKFVSMLNEIITLGRENGLRIRDLFVLMQVGGQLIKSGWKNQYHARKNHSYLVILQKGRYT